MDSSPVSIKIQLAKKKPLARTALAPLHDDDVEITGPGWKSLTHTPARTPTPTPTPISISTDRPTDRPNALDAISGRYVILFTHIWSHRTITPEKRGIESNERAMEFDDADDVGVITRTTNARANAHRIVVGLDWVGLVWFGFDATRRDE